MGLRNWLQLSLTEGIGPILTRRLIDAAGSAEAACAVSPALLRNIDGIGSAKASNLASALRRAGEQVDREIERAGRMGIRIICPDDACYPILLKSIPDPPTVLYMKGSLEDRDLHSVAIVGSRRCSQYGREQADRFGALLAGAGITVISGGARGIDSAAHRGAMMHPLGRTIAVLGSGLDVPYPPENAPLFEQIAQRGAVLSEFPLGTAPVPENFPRRNRIVSGLSRGVLVIEANERSGALITARQACDDHSRPVFALPGRVDNPLSAGPHLLIRDGAILVTKLDEILEGLGPLPAEAVEPTLFTESSESPAANPAHELADENVPSPRASNPDRAITITDRQQLILQQMGNESTTVDSIVDTAALPPQIILQELTFLSLKGLIKRIDGQSYVRCKRSS